MFSDTWPSAPNSAEQSASEHSRSTSQTDPACGHQGKDCAPWIKGASLAPGQRKGAAETNEPYKSRWKRKWQQRQQLQHDLFTALKALWAARVVSASPALGVTLSIASAENPAGPRQGGRARWGPTGPAQHTGRRRPWGGVTLLNASILLRPEAFDKRGCF